MIMNHFLWLLPLVFPHLSSPVILLERSDGNLFHWNHLMKGDKLVLHRSKRDWMWRQFFLSEEYTGSNYQYVGKVSVLERAFLSSKQGLEEMQTLDFRFPELCMVWHWIWTQHCVAGNLKKLDAIIKELKVAQIWITHSLRHEYSQRQRDWKWMRVGESRFETEYFVPGFSFLPLSFSGQSGSAETWQESTITGYFTHSFSFPPIDFEPICSGYVKEGTAIHQAAVQRHAIFMPH